MKASMTGKGHMRAKRLQLRRFHGLGCPDDCEMKKISNENTELKKEVESMKSRNFHLQTQLNQFEYAQTELRHAKDEIMRFQITCEKLAKLNEYHNKMHEMYKERCKNYVNERKASRNTNTDENEEVSHKSLAGARCNGSSESTTSQLKSKTNDAFVANESPGKQEQVELDVSNSPTNPTESDNGSSSKASCNGESRTSTPSDDDLPPLVEELSPPEGDASLSLAEAAELIEQIAITREQQRRVDADELKRMTQTAKTLKDDRKCAICLNHNRSVLFLPCAHVATCVSCSLKLESCPKCRVGVAERIRADIW